MGDFQQGRQTVMDRLKRRLNNYRSRTTNIHNHLEASASTIYSDQDKQTLLLKQRFIESKAKKTTKKDTRKQDSSISSMGQSKLLARGHDQSVGPGETDKMEAASKKQKSINGSISSSVASEMSNFQIVHQFQSIKNNSVASLKSNSISSSPIDSALNSNDKLNDAIGTSGSLISSEVDIKKENEVDLPGDSLLDDFGEFSNFDDIDMGINLDDIVHEFDLDNIKQENSNSCVDTFFKDEIGDNIFNEDQSSTSNIDFSSSLNTNKVKSAATSVSDASFSQYSSSVSQTSACTTFPSTCFSSQPIHSFSSTVVSTSSSMTSSYIMTNSLPKVCMNVNVNNMRQTDMVQAAQTLKQMAEPYQAKMSPSNNQVRPSINEYNYMNNSLGNNSTSASGNNTASNSMTPNASMYSQTTESDLKRRQQMMQSFPRELQQNSSTSDKCNLPLNNQSSSSSIPHTQSNSRQQPKQFQQVQNSINPQQMQTGMLPQQLSQQVSHANSMQQSPMDHQVAQTRLQSPLPQMMQQKPTQNQQGQQPMHQQHMPLSNQPQTNNGRNSLSPFSNQLSPMNYNHPQQVHNPMVMNPHYTNSVQVPNNTVRCSYPIPSNSAPAMGQVHPSNVSNPNCAQPRFMQQQMMGPVNMMRSPMVASGQMMGRPPPPEYRQTAMMQQQHQNMMQQPMNQGLPHMHPGGSGPMVFQMRPGMRPNSGVSLMTGGQVVAGLNQQNMSMNVPMMDSSGLSLPGNMNQNLPGGISNHMNVNSLPVSMNQVPGGGQNMAMMSRSAMMQRMRPHYNTAMGPAQMSPANRGEWRPMMMQQGVSPGMMIGSDVRRGYPQNSDEGMMTQSGTMMTVQRVQGPVMAIGRMPNSASMNTGMPNANIPASQNIPRHQGNPAAIRMSQQSVCSMGQSQHGIQGAHELQNPGIMMSQSQMDNGSGNINHKVQANSSAVSQMQNARNSPNVVPSIGGTPNIASMNQMQHMVQQPQNCANATMSNNNPRNNTPGSVNPGSPRNICQRPLSNPNHAIGSPMLASSSPSPVRPVGNAGRMMIGTAPSSRPNTMNMMPQQQQTPPMGTHMSAPVSHPQMPPAAKPLKPEDPNACSGMTNRMPQATHPNHPTHEGVSGPPPNAPQNTLNAPGPPPATTDDDFDLMFNDGEFAALLC